MKPLLLASLFLLVSSVCCPAAEYDSAAAWFTDATLSNSISVPAPAPPPPSVNGTLGKGVLLSHHFPVQNPLLEKANGYIGFWLQSLWDGNDGQRHRLLSLGDTTSNGFYLEKSPEGMLRYVMASPERTTASRADVSNWKSGQWHHVVISWFSRDTMPIGLPLWIDTVAVAGPLASGNTFVNPATLSNADLIVGSPSAQAVLDELIMRNSFDSRGDKEQIRLVYRDYFRTAPFSAVRIDTAPLRVPSDLRVVAGAVKQYGLKAKLDDQFIPITDFAVRYGQWADFDAKPFITWSSSDDSIASVDKNGRVTGHKPGTFALAANLHGLSDSRLIQVISPEQPDLDLLYVERLPRYSCKDDKVNPAPGDVVTSVIHIANYGYQPLPSGAEVLFQLIPEVNNTCSLDPGESAPVLSQTLSLPALKPGERTTLSVPWTWPVSSVWVAVKLDPAATVSEICEANNQVCELNTARPMHFALKPAHLTNFFLARKINHVGSFSHFDWINAQKLRMDVMLRDTKYPDICPNGITDMYRMDKIYETLGTNWFNEPWEKDIEFYDGGFPVGEPVDIMAIDSAIIHEQGHTCLALPDLYGYPVNRGKLFLKDENGEFYAGGPLFPCIGGDMLPLSSAVDVPCGVGYKPLMDSCHFWLHPSHAGKIESFIGYRGPHFWGVQGRQIPFRENFLKLFDINDHPLTGAAVYVYHVSHTDMGDFTTKYFADRPKFVGNTAADGRFKFPEQTDRDWDSPYTDRVDGKSEVWNPFGTFRDENDHIADTAGTPSVCEVEGLLLVKIVSDGQTELHWLPMTEFNAEFFRGNTYRGTYPIYTSLTSSGTTPVRRPRVPKAVRTVNLRPVAVPDRTNLTVHCGEQFTLVGTKSYDPEDQPLQYWWKRQDSYNGGEFHAGVSNTMTAAASPCTNNYVLCVLDGVRSSKPTVITVNVIK